MVMSVEEIEEALVGVGMAAERAHRVALAIDRAENAATVDDVDRVVSHAREILQGEIDRLDVEQRARMTELRSELKQELAQHDADNTRSFAELKQAIARLEGQSDLLHERVARLEARFDEAGAEARARHRQLMVLVISIGATVGTALIGGMVAILLRLFGAV